MTAKPASETTRSPGWIGALVAIVGVLGFVYFPLLSYCFREWLKPDYSHGFLVPAFAVYLAWKWKAWAPADIAWPDPMGLAFIVGGALLFLVAGFVGMGKEWLQGVSLVLNLCGATLLLGGPTALRWLWPSIVFLLFMFPLPYRIEVFLGWPLQKVAAMATEFVLQTIGYSTFRDGMILHCQDHVLEVKNACNGLSMLLTFFTLATAMAILITRPWLDKVIIILSAVPIAILSNVARIALTGVLYNEAGKELGDRVFHDFAGWMMMPLALGVLLIELKILDWVLQDDLGKASREEVIRNVTSKPAYLFMPAFEKAEAAKKAADLPPASRIEELNAGPRFAGRLLGLIALGAMAFTVYGSLVPFDFHSRDMDDACTAFKWAMTHRWWYESRSDALANVMLGVPLGFGLLGFLRSDRGGIAGDMLAGVSILPFCMGFAAAVEFAQLYFPGRTTAGSDVLCQGIGSIIGMTVWIVCGRWFVLQAAEVWSGADAAGRLLIAYLVLLAFVQLLPMDLSASPRDLYRKLRDDVVYVPFSEITEEKAWTRITRLMQVFGLFLPVGLLGARRASKRLLLPLLLMSAVGMEALQLIVRSRTSSATDVLVGACGILTGWWLANLRLRSPGRPPHPMIVALFVVWLLALLVISWQPFVSAAEPVAFGWMPGMPLESGHPLLALEEMITKVVLFALGGVLVSSRSLVRAALGGLVVSGLCEYGQTIFTNHTPCITDVILGGIGKAIGCAIRQRVETG